MRSSAATNHDVKPKGANLLVEQGGFSDLAGQSARQHTKISKTTVPSSYKFAYTAGLKGVQNNCQGPCDSAPEQCIKPNEKTNKWRKVYQIWLLSLHEQFQIVELTSKSSCKHPHALRKQKTTLQHQTTQLLKTSKAAYPTPKNT